MGILAWHPAFIKLSERPINPICLWHCLQTPYKVAQSIGFVTCKSLWASVCVLLSLLMFSRTSNSFKVSCSLWNVDVYTITLIIYYLIVWNCAPPNFISVVVRFKFKTLVVIRCSFPDNFYIFLIFIFAKFKGLEIRLMWFRTSETKTIL